MALFANKANNCKMGTFWIARDRNEGLWVHDRKPEKNLGMGEWGGYVFYRLNPDQFPEVQWEDDEPTEVELKTVKK